MNYSDLPDTLNTPVFIVDREKLELNLEKLAKVSQKSGCKILLAQKAFSMFSVYPLIAKYLDGTTASSLHEARLGHEHFGKETHIFSPAYTENDFEDILKYSNHMVFNSISQWEQFSVRALDAKKQCGLRVNPECSTQDHAIYDPCAPHSRFGLTIRNFPTSGVPKGISGLHFHTLCEQNSDALAQTLEAFESNFGAFLPGLKWLNWGGGHHITRQDYDVDLLIELIIKFRQKYNLDIYLEPGEAIALDAGYLVSTVVDIIDNEMQIAILDASAACHMPDVIEMPYRPNIVDSGHAGEKAYLYRLGGPTCLAGDVIGDYSFDRPLKIGDRLIFCDMAIYSMVKTNTFNGINLPDIALRDLQGRIDIIKQFNYDDFKNRLS